MSSVRAFLFSFQTKLVLALTAVIVLAIFVAGALFVIQTRDDRREQALDRVAAASPAIYQQAFFALVPSPQSPAGADIRESLNALALEQDVRILIVAPDDGVLYDTEGRLGGTPLIVPGSTIQDVHRGFVSWEPEEDFPERDLTFVSASSRFVTSRGQELPFRIVLAVETDTIADAWLGLLPSLMAAALIAVPIATVAGIVLARQVAHPVRRLTAASEAMAQGDFSQRVELNREDEIGRLARAFTTMAERVGRRETQMRNLLANVSHDLKTPMTSITGYAQALSDGTAEPGEAERIGAVIRDEAQHVNSLLADLLYLGEIDAGQLVAEQSDVSLETLVARCVRRVEPVAAAKDVSVTVDVADDTVIRDVDPEKLERALTNVLDNAAKFTPQGGEISVVGRRENGVTPPHIVCGVTNTGSALAEEDIPRVFDRFFRGDRARRTASGSGLGLAIAKELVELNRGLIRARNVPGGVTFEMTLPA